MPHFSVVLPTFNRKPTLHRAVASVLTQSFEDFELIVVDDGSTDGSTVDIEKTDRRIVVVRQKNQGVSAARNTGLRHARGSLVAFLDSDDEWVPFFLELAHSFFEMHQREDLFAGEMLIRDDRGNESRFPREEICHWYPRLASRVGSTALALPPGEHDDYRRVFSSGSDIGTWGAAIDDRHQRKEIRLYRGSVYEHLRWGYLAGLQALAITRRAAIAGGDFRCDLRSAEDFAYIASLCRAFPLNLISLPLCVKHTGGTDDHLATGRSALEFRRNLYEQIALLLTSLGYMQEEHRVLLGYKAFDVVVAALKTADSGAARHYLDVANASIPGFTRGRLLRSLMRLAGTRASGTVYNVLTRIEERTRAAAKGAHSS